MVDLMGWIYVVIVCELADDASHRSLVSNMALAYSFGLRHAFDADHISVFTRPKKSCKNKSD